MEFDEEEQCEGSSASRGTSRDGRVSVDSSLSASSASVNIDDDVVGAVVGAIWQGWNYQDNVAIGEVVRFDDISAVVFFWLQNRNHRSPLLLRMEALIVVRFSKDVLFVLNVNLLYLPMDGEREAAFQTSCACRKSVIKWSSSCSMFPFILAL